MEKERTPWIRWHPQWHVLWPLSTFVLGSAITYSVIHLAINPEGNILMWVMDTLYLLIACYYVLFVRRRDYETLGITERNWPQAMGVGAVLGLLLGAMQLFRYVTAGYALTAPRLELRLVAFTVPLMLIVAGEEVLFRGWFQSALEPAFGLLPSLLVSSAAYTVLPLAFVGSSAALHPATQSPIGELTNLVTDLPILFMVALFFNVVYRITGSLWSSGLASFLGRFSLAFVALPKEPGTVSPTLLLAVALALCLVVILYTRRWQRAVLERIEGPGEVRNRPQKS